MTYRSESPLQNPTGPSFYLKKGARAAERDSALVGDKLQNLNFNWLSQLKNSANGLA